MTKHADVLGVDETDSDEVIAAAYREQVRRFHPDQYDPDRIDAPGSGEFTADKLFRDVKQARDALIGEDDTEEDSLNYEWDDGEPIAGTQRNDPTERVSGPEGVDADGDNATDAPGDSGGPSDNPSGSTDSTSSTSEGRSTDGTGSESPWEPGAPADEADVDETIGVDIDDGSEASISTGESGSNTVVSRRGMLAMTTVGAGGLVTASWLSDSGSDRGRTDDHVVVSPSESLQDAADRIVSGGTLELEPGTYSQYLEVDVDMTVTAPEGATLSGAGTNVSAVTISSSVVEIDGLTIVDYDGGGIRGGDSDGELAISNVNVEAAGDVGLDLTGHQIELEDLTVRDTDATGLDLTSTEQGTVTVTGLVATGNENSGVGAYSEGYGVRVEGGQQVVIRDSEVTGSGNENVYVDPGATTDQDVEVRDVVVADSVSRSGLRIDGSREDVTVELAGIESSTNEGEGIRIGNDEGVADVHLEDLVVTDNGDTGLDVYATESGTVRLAGSTLERNENSGVGAYTEGYGVRVAGAEQVVIEETTVSESGEATVRIDGANVDGQTVEIRNVQATDSVARSGIRLSGSDGADEVSIEDTNAEDNGRYGFDLAGESVRIVDSDASGNDDGTLNLRDIDREEAEIRNSFDDAD